MLEYDLSQEDRIALRPFHRGVLALIEKRANELLGVEIDRPRGIYRAEGGVNVNNQQVCISYTYVKQDFQRAVTRRDRRGSRDGCGDRHDSGRFP